MSAAVAATALIAQGAALYATAVGTRMKIDEGIADYGREITRLNAQKVEQAGEANRQISAIATERDRVFGATTEEGTLSLQEAGRQASFRSQGAFTQAEQLASSEEARLGASGVRAGGSPLLAAQQNVDLAFAAAERVAESGRAGIQIGGVRLGNQLQGITAQAKNQQANISARSTLVSSEFDRRTAENRFKRNELAENRNRLVILSALGGAAGVASSFYQYGSQGAFAGTALGNFFQ